MFGIGACGKRGQHGFGGAPWAQHMHGAQGGGCGGPAALLSELNLSDEQLERAAELKLEGLAQCAQFKLAVGKLVKEIANELTKDQINRAKVGEIAQQIKAQKAQMGESMLERVLSFAEALTPEQRRKLKATAIRKFLGLDLAELQDE